MAPKRSAAESSPKTPQKQARLSSFFTSPSSKSEPTFASLEKIHAKEGDRWDSWSGLEAGPKTNTDAKHDQERADEIFARKLQEEFDKQQSERQNGEATEQSAQFSSKDVKCLDRQNGPSSTVTRNNDHSRPYEHTLGGTSTKQAPIDFDALDDAVDAIDFAQDIFEFSPQDVNTEAWPRKSSKGHENEGGPFPAAPYAVLSHAFTLLSTTKSRLTIVTILTNLLRTLMHHDQEALLPAIYLVSNHIAPPYDGVELGLGGSIVSRAIRDVTGKSSQHLRTLWNRTGDPGDVAYEAKKDIKTLVGSPRPLEVTKLFQTLHTIARISGTGSSAAKLSHVTKLLVASRGEETRFLVRTLHSHLRINAVRTTIATALARAFSLDGPSGENRLLIVTEKERKGVLAVPSIAKQRNDPRHLTVMDKLSRAEKIVREVRARHPNFGSIVPALLEGGISQLAERVPLRVGTPISPMLGSITRSLPDMFSKLGERPFVCEFKYDGQRVQIHAQHVPSDSEDANQRRSLLRGGKGRWVGRNADVFVRLFSRHLEDMTDKYPDINDLVPTLMGVENGCPGKVSSFIMDAEVVALGLDGSLLPFQTLANRSRKDVDIQNIKVAVGVFAFDLMELNGKSLLKASFRKRRNLLFEYLPACSPDDLRVARFDHVKSLESHDSDEVNEFFNLARQNKCEG